MAGYTRNDVTDQIANGNTVDAIPLDGEFDAIQAAFASVGGHTHNGSVGEGAPITVVGPAQDVVVTTNSVTPKVDNTVDLGSTTFEWKDLWIDGVANIDSLVADAADINAGTIDNTAIGVTTASTVRGTTITATTGFVGPLTGNVTGAVTGNASTATTLQTARTINGTSFNGSANIVTTSWGTGRLVTIGGTGKTVDGSAPVTWTLGEIGVGSLGTQNAGTVAITGGTITGITDLAVADGGTGASNAATALSNLGGQPLNARLTSLAGLDAVLGFVTQVTSTTFDNRTITGTANQITVTNGNGVSGNPTVSAVIATQAEAEAGANTTKLMTPQRVAQAVLALSPEQVPVGAVFYVAQTTAPTGYLKANGAAVSRTTYANLFASIGTTFGAGNGSTTFNLPDLRGEFIRSWDDARGVDAGRFFGSAQLDAFQGHWHRLTDTAGDSIEVSINQVTGSGGSSRPVTGSSTGTNAVREAVSNGVDGTPRVAAETRPRNVALLAVIKF